MMSAAAGPHEVRQPTWRMTSGISIASLALEAAMKEGIPSPIVDRARHFMQVQPACKAASL